MLRAFNVKTTVKDRQPEIGRVRARGKDEALLICSLLIVESIPTVGFRFLSLLVQISIHFISSMIPSVKTKLPSLSPERSVLFYRFIHFLGDKLPIHSFLSLGILI